jgi:hypothetical protein
MNQQRSTALPGDPLGERDPLDGDAEGEFDEAYEDGEILEEGEAETAKIDYARFALEDLPQLPKTVAVNRLYKAACEQGLSEGFAAVFANAVVDPAAARRALSNPTSIPIPGGVVEVVDLDVFTPGVVPLPTNNRTLEHRIYPVSGVDSGAGPLAGPKSVHGVARELYVEARSPDHLLHEALRAAEYIRKANDLAVSIADRGIVMPITLAAVELRHRDGTRPVTMLGSVDGSSRVTNAHLVLGLRDPYQTHYAFTSNWNEFRRFTNSVLVSSGEEQTARERRVRRARSNALISPARIFLRFTPSPGSHYDYARAVAAYVGMLHVDPPKPWTPTGKREAMAEAILRVFREEGVLDDTITDYLAGLLSQGRAGAAGLPTKLDEQATYVLMSLLPDSNQELIDRGIRDVTAQKSVSRSKRTDVIAELALRATRSQALTPAGEVRLGDKQYRDRAADMRAPYLRAARLPEYGTKVWGFTARPLADIFDAALAELELTPDRQARRDSWRSRLELAALAQYHLTFWGAMRREPRGGNENTDKRGLETVLRLMLEDRQGLQILRSAVFDGRAGRRPRLVDEHGEVMRGHVQRDQRDQALEQVVFDDGGDELPVTDYWIRYQGFPAFGPGNKPAINVDGDSADARLNQLRTDFLERIEALDTVFDQLGNINGSGGRALLDQRGWSRSETDDARDLLSKISDRLGYWAIVADQVNPDPQGAGEDGDDLDEEV